MLTWPVSVAGFGYSGFALQSTTNLNPPVVWNTFLTFSTIVNGQFVVTNSMSGAQQFFRLKLVVYTPQEQVSHY